MLSDGDQALAVALVGDTDTGLLSRLVPNIAAHYNYDDTYPGLGLDLLYVQRDLISVAQGTVWADVSIVDGDQQQRLSDRFAHLQAQQATVRAEILRIEQRTRASRPAMVGMITATVPEPAPFVGGLDASDVGFRGSPYYAYPGGNGTLPVVRD